MRLMFSCLPTQLNEVGFSEINEELTEGEKFKDIFLKLRNQDKYLMCIFK